MKLSIIDIENKEVGKKEMPKQFREDIRPDLIRRAVLTIQNNNRQPYGAKADAGGRHSVKISKRRRNYRGCYGLGISRVPRKILSRMGTRMNWQAAQAPGTVGGRRAHPPKPRKIWAKHINIKERRKAIRSAMAATVIKEAVQERGHLIPTNYPFIISKDFENLGKTKKLREILVKLGFEEELMRASIKKVRAGKGKARGRKYKKRTGPLIVVSKKCNLMKSARNLPGLNIVDVKLINAELLAPGAVPGRATLWTDSAIEVLEKENLFC